MEFTYNESRKCKRSIIVTKIIFLLFHFFSVCYDYNNIKKDKYFTYYLLTLLSIFMSICNNIRYEYAYYKISGYIFTSPGEFIQWKNKNQLKNILCLLLFFEQGTHVWFVIETITSFRIVTEHLFYCVSILIIYAYTLITIILALGVFIFCCIFNFSMIEIYLLHERHDRNMNISDSQVLNNVDNTNNINVLNTVIYIDNTKECCICLDKNNNEWIRTQCNHEFHKTCINNWYNTVNTCPVCRSNL